MTETKVLNAQRLIALADAIGSYATDPTIMSFAPGVHDALLDSSDELRGAARRVLGWD
ncbi:hypothetical protein ACQX2R_04575 [Corynebacterium diphtheriae]|uniref:Uncharacterized protein n=1 Tax=Corynebacterium diphtheriae TaxID=1717 RepID=A0A811G043_CORDP|nr:hypothetical protein [Corynebacterium diphtheriae]MBG9295036.1 hypothetical protein [Corynebacterium diphtheriae bv. mitis]MBG9306637.1 hypothetical protein [Corynebacterium diphtheriae bv. mitis]MBG9316459.1 hypothetical protein [Corynebacterium diphtheriae bv. mitis]MBG9335626.1 hypothetical protein [Corynebacterium diphtheriae bv. gravis]CAB0543062.1 hypothetical protein CIP107522_00713 [Corynebacterium diphtheriae]